MKKSIMLSKAHYGGKHLKPYRDFLDHSYVSLKHRYFFHTVGKAANSSVKAFFYTHELTDTHWSIPSVHSRIASPLLSPFQLCDQDMERVFFSSEFTRFVFVRNPFSRLLSCFLDRIHDHKSRPYLQLCNYAKKKPGYSFSFDEFIQLICSQTNFQQNNHWRLMYADALCPIVPYTFIGKQETFKNDMNQLIDLLGIPLIEYDLGDRSNSLNLQWLIIIRVFIGLIKL